MAGFQIVDTYKAYKVREKKVTTWLKNTAQKLGYNSSATWNENASGSQPVRINEIPSIVKLIVSHGEPIPENLRQLLRDVISHRKEASVFYKSNPNLKGDEGHAHYIRVLENALRTFEGSTKNNSTDQSQRNAAPGHSKADAEFNNLFDLLEVENSDNVKSRRNSSDGASDEASDHSENGKDKPQTKNAMKIKYRKRKGKAGKVSKTQKAITKRNVDMNFDILDSLLADNLEDEKDELYFMIYCFFKDFNYIREYLQERWCDYNDGLISLAAVSVATNTAFELLQRSERELLSQIPPSSGLGNYQRMANLLFFDVGLAHVNYNKKSAIFGEDKDEMDAAIYEEADFICLPRYWNLAEWLANAPPKKVPTMNNYIGTTPNYQAQGVSGKMKRDKQIIYELLAECCLLKVFKLNTTFILPVEDELTQGMIKMLATRQIPVWLVFACQIFCDIRWILETNVASCHEKLQFMGGRVDSILNDYITFAKSSEMSVPSVIHTTIDEVQCWITKDFAEPRRTDLHQSHGVPDNMIEPFFYLRRQPILCGLIIFRFSLTMNEFGLKNSNEWGSIIGAAHLYNAVRQELPDFPQWLDMEALILIHSKQRIFWTNVLPSSPAQYGRCYDRASGVVSLITQRKASVRNAVIEPTEATHRGIGPIPGVSMQYHERFCFGRQTKIHNLPNVEKVLNSIAENEMEDSLAGLRLLGSTAPQPLSLPDWGTEVIRKPNSQASATHALTAQFQKTRTLTNVQLLDVLCRRISQESYALHFDYFSFHQTCTLLLQMVYEEFRDEMDEELSWRHGEMPVVVYWVFELLLDETKRASLLGRLRPLMEGLVTEKGSKEVESVKDLFSVDRKREETLKIVG